MAIRIDGKQTSATVREEITQNTRAFIQETGIVPGLAVVLVGSDPASAVYVRNKKKACEQVGFYSESYELPEDTDRDTLLELIDRLNRDDRIHGILVQLPLPRHLDADLIIHAIRPEKDVDCFHPQNVGAVMLGRPVYLPCTPAGIMELLDRYGVDVSGKHCVIVGRSNIVGKPMALLMLSRNATVTVCHSRTENLSGMTRQADVLIVAVGRPGFIRGDDVKPGAVVIDVGINRLSDGKLCGDVDYESVFPVASAITPVPGGVGPMTITMLMQNTLTAAKNSVVK